MRLPWISLLSCFCRKRSSGDSLSQWFPPATGLLNRRVQLPRARQSQSLCVQEQSCPAACKCIGQIGCMQLLGPSSQLLPLKSGIRGSSCPSDFPPWNRRNKQAPLPDKWPCSPPVNSLSDFPFKLLGVHLIAEYLHLLKVWLYLQSCFLSH